MAVYFISRNDQIFYNKFEANQRFILGELQAGFLFLDAETRALHIQLIERLNQIPGISTENQSADIYSVLLDRSVKQNPSQAPDIMMQVFRDLSDNDIAKRIIRRIEWITDCRFVPPQASVSHSLP